MSSLKEQVAKHFEKKLKWSDIKELVREALELSEVDLGNVDEEDPEEDGTYGGDSEDLEPGAKKVSKSTILNSTQQMEEGIQNFSFSCAI